VTLQNDELHNLYAQHVMLTKYLQ